MLILSPPSAAAGNARNCTVCRSKGSPRPRPRRGIASGKGSRGTRTGSAVDSVSGRCWSGGRSDFASRKSGLHPSFVSPLRLADLFFGRQCWPDVVLRYSSSECRRSSARRPPRRAYELTSLFFASSLPRSPPLSSIPPNPSRRRKDPPTLPPPSSSRERRPTSPFPLLSRCEVRTPYLIPSSLASCRDSISPLPADSSSTYIPVHITRMEATIFDDGTDRQVATGTWSGSFKSKTLTDIKVPVTFSYAAINSSDTTCPSFPPSPASIPSLTRSFLLFPGPLAQGTTFTPPASTSTRAPSVRRSTSVSTSTSRPRAWSSRPGSARRSAALPARQSSPSSPFLFFS